jgi:hypothetical protein
MERELIIIIFQERCFARNSSQMVYEYVHVNCPWPNEHMRQSNHRHDFIMNFGDYWLQNVISTGYYLLF